jgi:hypothetical protein
VIDKGAILDFDVIADVYIKIDVNIFSDDTVLSDYSAFPNLHKMPDPGSGPYLCLWRYFGRWLNCEAMVNLT